MTLNLCCKEITDCHQDFDCIPARVLSKEATQEILGDNLSSLIAIGKDGQPVLFVPYNSEISMDCETPLNETDSKTSLEITIQVPKHHTITARRYCVCYPPGGKPPYGCWRN